MDYNKFHHTRETHLGYKHWSQETRYNIHDNATGSFDVSEFEGDKSGYVVNGIPMITMDNI